MKFKQMWFIFGSHRKQINRVETWNKVFHFLDCISPTVANKKCNYSRRSFTWISNNEFHTFWHLGESPKKRTRPLLKKRKIISFSNLNNRRGGMSVFPRQMVILFNPWSSQWRVPFKWPWVMEVLEVLPSELLYQSPLIEI